MVAEGKAACDGPSPARAPRRQPMWCLL